jgi:hypothetical protein
VGYCDAMRVGSDVGTLWNADGGNGNDGVGGGIMNAIQESYHDQFFNRVFWINDPDVIFLRDVNIELDEAEVTSLALWSAILGGSITVSDFFDELPPRRLQLWQFICSLEWDEATAQVPLWGKRSEAPYILTRMLKDGTTAVFMLNISNRECFQTLCFSELLQRSVRAVREWSASGVSEPEKEPTLKVSLPPHHSRLWKIS